MLKEKTVLQTLADGRDDRPRQTTTGKAVAWNPIDGEHFVVSKRLAHGQKAIRLALLKTGQLPHMGQVSSQRLAAGISEFVAVEAVGWCIGRKRPPEKLAEAQRWHFALTIAGMRGQMRHTGVT